ncbi:MAG: alpha/beta hydrolase [Salinibacterium sp.]|nr:alpha/beta hydrolase [Salinibacterium sp.]
MTTQFLGTIAYEVSGEGPLVLCIPGMADLRSTFRFLAPALVAAGYRVAIIDLRGHGDSTAAADPAASYDNSSNAADAAALIAHLGGPAVVLGNSMGAAIGVLIAAEHPELVSGLVLVGPFVRNGRISRVMKALMRVLTTRPLVAAVWNAYLPSLYAGRKPADFAEYRATLIATLKRSAAAVSKTMRTSHDDAEAALSRVDTPVLVVMGELDPDFSTPQAEAEWIVDQLGGSIVMVPEAGHYPQSQRPDVMLPAVTSFLQSVTHSA